MFYKDLEDIRKLDEKMREYKNTDLASVDKIYWLISECKRYGTKAFSGIARAAFIATSLLNSLVRVGGISIDEKNKFLSSIYSIISYILGVALGVLIVKFIIISLELI